MKMFVCKGCGYTDLSSSDSWKVVRQKNDMDEPAELLCPKCDNGELLIMQINITVMKRGMGKNE